MSLKPMYSKITEAARVILDMMNNYPIDGDMAEIERDANKYLAANGITLDNPAVFYESINRKDVNESIILNQLLKHKA